jgi:glycosyltransferase involved in cell wall biosynthesis
MHIIYIGQFRLPAQDAAAARVLNVGRSLRQAGHQVSYISWGGQQKKEHRGEDGVYRVDGFPYEVTGELDFKGNLSKKVWKKLCQGKKTKYLLQDRLGQYDAIIAYNCSLIQWLVPFCKRNHIYLISDVTEWYDYSELKLYERPIYYYKMRYLQKKIKNKIVISKYLENYYNKSHNIIIPATCDASEVKWHQNIDNAKAYVKSFNGVTLIYAGNPAKKDLVHNVINVVQRLVVEGSNIRFLILGITRENYLLRYSAMLHTRSLHEDVIFLGRVPQEVIPSFYHQADFMVLLRDQTRKSNAGFPTKFAESFTSGTPVIANLTSDIGQYLKDGETGLVVGEPSEETVYRVLKEKVLTLSSEAIADMKKNVESVAKKLDYHAFVEPLRDFMNKLR